MANLSDSLSALGGPVRGGQSVGSALTATRLNAIMAILRALARGENLVAGYGLRKSATSEGVMLSAGTGGRGSSSAAHPFQVRSAGTAAQVSVGFGQVNSITPTMGGGYEVGSDDPPVLAVATGVVYLAVILNDNGAITSASIHNDAKLPTADATHGYITLARVTVTKDAVVVDQSVTHSLGHQKCGSKTHNFWGV